MMENGNETGKKQDGKLGTTNRNFARVFASTQEFEGGVGSAEQGKILDSGVIPPWLSGIYLKIGPGKFDFEVKEDKKKSSNNKNKENEKENGADVFTVNNFLDGYCVLTKFNISDGKVTLYKKFLKSDAYQKALGAGRPILPESHTCCSPDPNKSFFRKLIPSLVPDMSDNTSHALFSIGGSIFASNESYHLWRIDPNTLETLKKYDTTKLLGLNQASAHPISDEQNTYSVGTAMSATGCKYVIVKIPDSSSKCNSNNNKVADDDNEALSLFKQYKSLCSISPWSMTLSSFMHSIAMTRNYIIVIEQPFFTNLSKVAKSITFGKNYCYSDWVESPSNDLTNRIYIIDKESGLNLALNVELFTKTRFIFSHFINTFETTNTTTTGDNNNEEILVLDVAAYKNKDVFDCDPLRLTSLRSSGPNYLNEGASGHRFLIPLHLLKNEKRWKDLAVDGTKSLISDNVREKYTIGCSSSSSKNKTKAIGKIEEEINGDENGGASAVKMENNKIIISPQVFTNKGIEWPTINRELQGEKYKFFYGSSGLFKGNEEYSNSVFKINLETGETVSYSDENYIFGEPYFIREPSGATGVGNGDKKNNCDEDAGVILVVTHDTRAGKDAKDSLCILNARDMKLMARVVFESHIPPSNHGLFIPK